MRPYYLILASAILLFSSCIAIFDEGNFNDQNQLKRWLEEERLTVVSIRVFEATRPDRSSPFVTQRDTLIATAGDFFFHEDGSPLRDLTYTAADGTITEGSWSVSDFGDDDDFHLEMNDLPGLFGPGILHDRDFELIEWGDNVLRVQQNRLLNRDELQRDLEIVLMK